MSNELKETKVKEKLNENIIEVQLKHPIELDGVLLNSVKLDFSDLTGEDVLKVDEELRRDGKIFDNIYNHQAVLLLAAKASKMIPDDLAKLRAGDYLEVAFQTRNFFIMW